MSECDHTIVWTGKTKNGKSTSYCWCSITDSHLANIISLLAKRIDRFVSIANELATLEMFDALEADKYAEILHADKIAESGLHRLEIFLDEQERRRNIAEKQRSQDWTTTKPLFPRT